MLVVLIVYPIVLVSAKVHYLLFDRPLKDQISLVHLLDHGILGIKELSLDESR
jgi:hypothetical protein